MQSRSLEGGMEAELAAFVFPKVDFELRWRLEREEEKAPGFPAPLETISEER